MTFPEQRLPVVVLMPVFNDWAAAASLLLNLDAVLHSAQLRAHIVVIDDGSVIPRPHDFPGFGLHEYASLRILRLRRNLGHQRALAVGLAFVDEAIECYAVVVMDADGEDRPEDVVKLLATFDEHQGRNVVFAERLRRSENLMFRFFYYLYRHLHYTLTGIRVRFGNFSVLSRRSLSTLVVVSELWSHYTAAVVKAKLPYVTMATTRGRRLSGESHMDVVALIIHGLSAISVFGDVVGVRLLAGSVFLSVPILAGVVATIAVRGLTGLAIPGWATYTVGILLIILAQLIMLSLVFVFMILSSRANVAFLPIRDYKHFVDAVDVIG